MAKRPKKRPCRGRNCPDKPAEPAPPQVSHQFSDAKLDQRVVNVENEGVRLWNHVLYGTGTCVGMLAGYTQLNVPGNPLPQLHSLAARLQEIIHQHEKKHEISASQDDGPGPAGSREDAGR